MKENKTAKEMFEALGYKCFDNHPEEKEDPNKWITQDCRVIEYRAVDTINGIEYTLFIRFHINGKIVEIGAGERKENIREFGRYRNPVFNTYELQAINQQCKELGWL